MDSGQFILFGTTHWLTLLAMGIIGYLGIRKLQDYNPILLQNKWHQVFAYIALVNGIIWRFMLIEINDFHVNYDLPFHVCSLSTYMLAIYFWFPNQKLYDILFYWIMTGSTLGILIPDLVQPFPHIRFFAMFVSHGVMIFFIVYLFVVQHRRPSMTGYRLAFWILTIYAFGVAVPVNLITHGNYLFTLQPPDVNFFLIRFLPPWPWYIPVLLGFFYFAFWVLHRLMNARDVLKDSESISSIRH